MKVTVRFFAALRDRVGFDSIELELEDGATVGSAIERIGRDHPDVHDYRGRMMTARNREYVREDMRLRDGDEVALFPPVSGG
jgi:molybdopterin converting factor subunit 1